MVSENIGRAEAEIGRRAIGPRPTRTRASIAIEAVAFFDTLEFTDLWQRVTPA